MSVRVYLIHICIICIFAQKVSRWEDWSYAATSDESSLGKACSPVTCRREAVRVFWRKIWRLCLCANLRPASWESWAWSGKGYSWRHFEFGMLQGPIVSHLENPASSGLEYMRMAGFNSRYATATHRNWPPDWLLLRRNLLKMPGNCETMWTMWTTMWKGARLCGTLWNYVKRCETHKPIEISWHRAHCKAQTECHHKTLRFFIASASVGAEATLRSSVARLSSGSGAKRWNIVSLSTEARFKV